MENQATTPTHRAATGACYGQKRCIDIGGVSVSPETKRGEEKLQVLNPLDFFYG